MEANIDYLKGIDFKKGCYVGQENTARMKLKNKIRRKLFPINKWVIVSGKINHFNKKYQITNPTYVEKIEQIEIDNKISERFCQAKTKIYFRKNIYTIPCSIFVNCAK